VADAVICRACGAKIKEGRQRCLRCDAALEAVSAAPAGGRLAGLGLRRGPMLLAGSLLSLLALSIVVVTSRADQTGAAAAAPAPAATSAPRVRADPPTPPDSAPGEPRFLDPRIGGRVAYAQGDYLTAADRYRKAIEANPSDADALNNLAQVLARMGNPADALPFFERAITLYPGVWAYRFNLAHAYGEMGNWKRAVTEYRSAGELFPDDYVTQFNLARALHKQGREQEAIVEYQKAIALAPGEPSFHLSIGLSYERLNRPNDAVESYRRYLELSPEAPDAQQVKDRVQILTGSVAADQAGRPAPAKPL